MQIFFGFSCLSEWSCDETDVIGCNPKCRIRGNIRLMDVSVACSCAKNFLLQLNTPLPTSNAHLQETDGPTLPEQPHMYRCSAAPWPFIGILFAASSPVSVIESFDVGKLLFSEKTKGLDVKRLMVSCLLLAVQSLRAL